MNLPPCLRPGDPLNDCAATLYAYRVEARSDLPAPWAGWKLRGAVLVSPDGDRINVQRLRGLLFSESLRKRKTAPEGRRVVSIKSGLAGGDDCHHTLPMPAPPTDAGSV